MKVNNHIKASADLYPTKFTLTQNTWPHWPQTGLRSVEKKLKNPSPLPGI